MKIITNLLCKFLIVGILGIVSTQASRYDEYLKELGELKIISIDARSKKPETQTHFKNEYNELAREVNKYIDYFIQVVDEKAPFNFKEIDMVTKSINQKAEKLKYELREINRKYKIEDYVNPLTAMGWVYAAFKREVQHGVNYY